MIAISATFTAEALEPALAFWAGELGLDSDIRFAGYNQVFQQLLDPGGLFGRNRGGFNVALVRFDDWVHDGGAASPQERAAELVDAIRTSAASCSAPLILAICPPAPENQALFEECRRTVCDAVAGLTAVYPILPAELLALYPVAEIYDPHGDQLGRLPYTPVFFAALATAIARQIHAIAHTPYKVIALDCDNTLWSGICGEDGPQGVSLDPPRRALQEFMLDRRRAGMLLALASKNNEEDVIETFGAHPEMPLRWDDFTARRIDWNDKGGNLRSLAEELGFAPDSFILVDDSPKECTEAQAAAPEALALALPPRADEIPDFLRHVWAFDRARVTQEDRQRSGLYAQRAERARAERTAANLEEFLASLRLEIRIAPMLQEQLARVAQLTQRTNQMNVTCVRRTEADVQALLAAGGAECLTVDVSDRFGSYGLTGVVMFRCSGGVLAVDTFLLSCRVLGRGVEHRLVARLGEIARERGLARVEIPFVPAQRNRPAGLFLESLRAPDQDGVFRFSAEEASLVSSKSATRGSRADQGVRPTAVANTGHRIDYARIATGLRDPAAVLERVRAASRRVVARREEPVAPRTPLERDLAELWAGLLNVPAVGIRDNFFELGGHSLLAVQLLSRVRQIYGVDLSLEVVYSGEFTVAELAKAVELKEIEQAGGDYQDLLKELESLSDDEARALLAEEQDAE